MRNARHVLVALLLSFPFVAHAETVVQCEAMEGYAYFYPSPFVKEEQQGFAGEQATAVTFSISLEEDKYDVVRLSENGKSASSRAEGAKVIPLGNNKDHFVLLVSFPDKTAELFTYHKPSKTLTLLQLKYGVLITSSKMLVSHCK